MKHLIGTGGHSQSVEEVLLDKSKIEYRTLSIEQFKFELEAEVYNECDQFFLAIGDVQKRFKLAQILNNNKLSTWNIISYKSFISDSMRIGEGSVVMPGSTVRINAKIGSHTVLNSSCVVEHGCEIGDYVNISPNATLCGDVRVGDHSIIGAGSIVLPKTYIAPNVIVGAGSIVLNSLTCAGTYVGTPAVRIKP